MKKCRKEGKDWIPKALLAYRTTPSAVLDGHSPDELFLGRRMRTKISLVHPSNQKMPKVDLKSNKANWLPATIIERVDNSSTYRADVPILHRAVHRHANQIRRRFPVELETPQIGQANGNILAGDQKNRTPIKVIEKAKSPIGQIQNAPRRSARDKRAPQRMDMDPSKPKYDLVRP
ncbi:hypothetical protein niasHT_031260 [Heterodera trifolii]|uniref:Uncharacterized protein n=1 Tax=Heterodera trifolii TaxID=157864 RepID=A0ABD2IFI0_9BILA